MRTKNLSVPFAIITNAPIITPIPDKKLHPSAFTGERPPCAVSKK